MRRTTKTLIPLLFLTFTMTALAQRDMYGPRWVSATIDRVHEHLSRAYSGGWRISPGDRHRVDRAEEQLRRFSDDWNRGRFDAGDLDGAIGSIQRVVDGNRMPPRLRDALYGDLDRLREMRRAHDRRDDGDRGGRRH